MPYWRDSWRGVVAIAIPLARFRETSAGYDNPLTSAAGANFGLAGGTHGTASPKLQSEGANGNEKTSTARLEFVLPPEYVPGGAITLRVHCRRSGAPAVPPVTLDAQVFKIDREAGIGAELYAGAAQDITSWADMDFALNSAQIVAQSLAPGDVLDIELTGVVNDTGGSGTFVLQISSVQMLLLERF